jgi:hypothetical protein
MDRGPSPKAGTQAVIALFGFGPSPDPCGVPEPLFRTGFFSTEGVPRTLPRKSAAGLTFTFDVDIAAKWHNLLVRVLAARL